MSKALAERFFDANARIERVVPLFASQDDGAVSDSMEEFLSLDLDEIEQAVGKLPAWLKDEDIGSYEFNGAFGEWLFQQNKLGFLMQFATPVMTNISKTARSYSWGYYSTHWVYGDTFEQAMEAGLAWVEQQRKRERAKPKPKTKPKPKAKP